MRATCVFVLAVCVLPALVGCEAIQTALNPMPAEGGSRVASKLENLPAPDPAKVKTIAVYKFENRTGFPNGLAITNGMTDMIITALVKSGHFRVVEREGLDEIQKEKGLQREGEATGTAGTTKMAGAQLLIRGNVTEMSETGGGGFGISHWGAKAAVQTWTARVALDMRIVDVGTSQVLGSVPVGKTVRKTGIAGGLKWGISGNIQVSNALDLAVRETIDEAVYLLVTKYGAQ